MIIARRGAKFALVTGSVIIGSGYLLGTQLLGSAAGILIFSVVVSFGVGFAFAALPALINGAVPVSETAAANGINTLARSLGTSTASAVLSAVLAGMTVTFAGHALPSLTGFRTALFIAAGAAAVGALIAMAIPSARPVESAPAEVTAAVRPRAHDLEQALSAVTQPSAAELLSPAPTLARHTWLDQVSYLVLRRLDDSGVMTLAQLAATFGVDPAVLGRRISGLVRDGLVHTVADAGDVARFTLTEAGRHRVRGQRAHNVTGLQRVTAGWDDGDVAALSGYLGRLGNGIQEARRGDRPRHGEPDTERLRAMRPAIRHTPAEAATRPLATMQHGHRRGPQRPVSPAPRPRTR
jgi:DNA-binding MarR family transcriptional regulator